MRLYTVVLLGAATFLSGGNLLLRSLKSSTTIDVPSHSVSHNSKATSSDRRFLRSNTDELDEERVVSLNAAPSLKTVFPRLQTGGNALHDDFVKLGLKKADKNLFKQPSFLSWATSVDYFNMKNPDKKISVVSILSAHIEDDVLAKMIEAARHLESTKTIANTLQTEQMTIWKRAGVSTDTLFEKLKLNDDAIDVLANPALQIWIRYANEFNPGAKTTLFDTLLKYHDEKTLSRLLIASKKVSTTAELANGLQKQLLQFWLSNSKSPEKVFKLLFLDEGLDNILTSPQLQTWINYATAFKTKWSDKPQVTLIEVLRANYSDEALSQMLVAAKKAPNSKIMAKYLEGELLTKISRLDETIQHWLSNAESPTIAFKLLMLDVKLDNILTSPQLKAWIKYATAFKKKWSDKPQVTLIDVLRANYSDEALSQMLLTAKKQPGSQIMARYLEGELLTKWALDLKAPAYVKNMLGREARDKYLQKIRSMPSS